jgi:hypothetical protein
MAFFQNTRAAPRYSRLERKTQRRIVLECDENAAWPKFNEQDDSPLFTVLPREIRDLIWDFTLAPYEDPNGKFKANEYFCRPGHEARLKTDFNLLLTCRRVWLEAHAMPMLQAEHSFYYNRAAPDARNPQWMAQLTDHNRQNFGQLHLFVQMYMIEHLNASPGRLRDYFLKTHVRPGDFQPRIFHVTLRHTDWWDWEQEAPLRLEDRWVKAMLDSPDLRGTETFKLELETLDYKVWQLEPIIERLKRMESEEMETHVIDGQPTKTKFVLVDQSKPWTWEGPTNIDGHDFDPYKGKTKLKYHVVTLTWKLRFPDMPGAFVPHLRRAPRFWGQSGPLLDTDAVEPRSTKIQPEDDPHVRPMLPHDMPTIFPRRRRRANRANNNRVRMASPEQWKVMCDNVHTNARLLADATEKRKRLQFEDMMADFEMERYRAKWKAEGSLLRFA